MKFLANYTYKGDDTLKYLVLDVLKVLLDVLKVLLDVLQWLMKCEVVCNIDDS